MIRLATLLIFFCCFSDVHAQLALEEANGSTGLRGNSYRGQFLAVSPKGYSGQILYDDGSHSQLQGAYYLDAACTDGPYVDDAAGSVIMEPIGSGRGTGSVVYIPVDAQSESLAGREVWLAVLDCRKHPSAPVGPYFRALPNDPAVTGFENSYEPPFRVRAISGGCVFQDGFECPARTNS